MDRQTINMDSSDSTTQLSIAHWQQNLEEVEIHIPFPEERPRSSIVCDIQASRLRVGILAHNNQEEFSIDGKLFGTVETDESTWTLEDGNIVIYLQKSNKGLVWEGVFAEKANETAVGGTTQLNPLQIEEAKQKLMRERWQEENPGFDFRDAEFNGAAPDPREFMGGVKYS